MSVGKSKGIPLAKLIEPSAVNNRNLGVLLGEQIPDAKLTQAIARELLKSREAERSRAIDAEKKAARFKGGRSKGADRVEAANHRKRIRELGKKFESKTARELFDLPAARGIRESITFANFANLLSKEAPRRRNRKR